MKTNLAALGLTTLLSLTACGDTTTERVATGGVAGAIVGGPVGAVVGAIRAGQGKYWRYPISIRFVRGARGKNATGES
jgi:hypothetical protein